MAFDYKKEYKEFYMPKGMQNGEQILKIAFTDIESRIYNDSLHITDIEDLVDYLGSLTSFKAINDVPVERLKKIIAEHAVNRAVDLPKEYGMFIAKGVVN